jgi:hypothetical protein
MPPPFNQGDELSLRHLPDVSDASFSFQIPGMAKEENLLAQDNLDFFGGIEMSPHPLNSGSSTAKELLTVSELTPRPAVEKQPPQFSKKPFSFPTLSYDETHDTIPKQANPISVPEPTNLNTEGISKPSLMVITHSSLDLVSTEGPPASGRIGAIKKEVDVLTEEMLGAAAVDNQRPKGIRRSLVKKQPFSCLVKRERHGLRQRQVWRSQTFP